MKFLILLLIEIVFLSLCTQKTQDFRTAVTADIKQQAIIDCIDKCNSVKNIQDLNNGPCLLDPDPYPDMSNWVCDIAHDPRQDVDNLPENQCSAFREGRAKHFVELDENCNLIRAV
jgi:hypothetical protein